VAYRFWSLEPSSYEAETEVWKAGVRTHNWCSVFSIALSEPASSAVVLDRRVLSFSSLSEGGVSRSRP
jgi:hypothetical protein